jgi:hypothetical protein
VVSSASMSQRQPSQPGTLLGVAPPRLESSGDPPQRSPVFVRAGTSVADVEPPPVPRMALPSRPPLPEAAVLGASEPPPAFTTDGSTDGGPGAVGRVLSVARRYPVLWMAAAPGLMAIAVVTVLLGTSPPPKARAAVVPALPPQEQAAASDSPASSSPTAATGEGLKELEAKSIESLSAAELLRLADGHAAQRRDAAKALCQKVQAAPALAADKATQGELLHLVTDAETARDALGTLAKLPGPLGPDLLYEVWTGTTLRNDATELARQLLYSGDVRRQASPALSVALELRSAEKCEQFQAALPHALKDGDRRSLHLLVKLTAKRGCGPKKADDCYACLREGDELTATINAVKSRRPPSLAAQ